MSEPTIGELEKELKILYKKKVGAKINAWRKIYRSNMDTYEARYREWLKGEIKKVNYIKDDVDDPTAGN